MGAALSGRQGERLRLQPLQSLRRPFGEERPGEGRAPLGSGRPDGQGEHFPEVQASHGGGGQRGGGGEAAPAGRLGPGPSRDEPWACELQPAGAGHRSADGATAGPAPRLQGDGPLPHGADDQREAAPEADGDGQQTGLPRRERYRLSKVIN